MNTEQPFERKIVKQTPQEDGTVDVVYERGHEATFIVPPVQESYGCAQCVDDYVEKHRHGLEEH